jgi:UDP-N-acetyl-D-mannosaminuronic acid transferase (WecB/TagA/CpsF family)
VLHDGHRSKSPVDRVEPKVRREVIHQVVIALPDGKSVVVARRARRDSELRTECTLLSFWTYLTCSGTSSSDPSGVAITQVGSKINVATLTLALS